MKIIVLSRNYAERYEPKVPAILISITDPEQSEADIQHEYLYEDILRLKFHDLEQPIPGYKFLVMFNESMAQDILNFVENYKDEVELIVVHCEAGISRSAGVAAALGLLLNNTCEEFYIDRFFPNTLVKSTILKAAKFYN